MKSPLDWPALIVALVIAVGFWLLLVWVPYIPPSPPGETVITSPDAEHLPDPNEEIPVSNLNKAKAHNRHE